MTLLHFVASLPAYLGFNVHAPLADIDVGTALLDTPAERRPHERWLADYLSACGASLEKKTNNGYALNRVAGSEVAPPGGLLRVPHAQADRTPATTQGRGATTRPAPD
jgi:hypothetical protein